MQNRRYEQGDDRDYDVAVTGFSVDVPALPSETRGGWRGWVRWLLVLGAVALAIAALAVAVHLSHSWEATESATAFLTDRLAAVTVSAAGTRYRVRQFVRANTGDFVDAVVASGGSGPFWVVSGSVAAGSLLAADRLDYTYTLQLDAPLASAVPALTLLIQTYNVTTGLLQSPFAPVPLQCSAGTPGTGRYTCQGDGVLSTGGTTTRAYFYLLRIKTVLWERTISLSEN
jgi:hypothetical protein